MVRKPAVSGRRMVHIEDGLISAIGTDSALPDTECVVDAENKIILPSFVDCHTHLASAALMNIAKTGGHWRSKRDALDDVKNLAGLDTTSEWLLYFNADWESWEDPSPPSARELEDVAPGRNVLISCVSLHRGVLSEIGLQIANVDPRAHQLESEALTPEQAVHAYTLDALKGITGKAKPGIDVGALADFVILSDDPFEPGASVESAWIGGEKVYDAASA